MIQLNFQQIVKKNTEKRGSKVNFTYNKIPPEEVHPGI